MVVQCQYKSIDVALAHMSNHGFYKILVSSDIYIASIKHKKIVLQTVWRML